MNGDALLSPSRADSVPASAAAGAVVGDHAFVLQLAENEADGVVTGRSQGPFGLSSEVRFQNGASAHSRI